VRALSPAATPPKRPRIGWILAAIVVLNAVIATLVVIFLAHGPATETAVTVVPAGDGSVEARVRDLLQRLDQEQRELESKLTEIQDLRALVVELSEKVRQYEQQDTTCDRTVPKRIERQPVDPYDNASSCDEVACVLNNYEGACCAKFRKPRAPVVPKHPSTPDLPDALDRQSIVTGLASVKARVAACAEISTAKGTVKVQVHVDARAVVEATPDAALGECVRAVVSRAVFPRTKMGGGFGYPFVF